MTLIAAGPELFRRQGNVAETWRTRDMMGRLKIGGQKIGEHRLACSRTVTGGGAALTTG